MTENFSAEISCHKNAGNWSAYWWKFLQVPAKKPSYDDDFDSDESEEDKPLKPPPKKQPAKKPSKPAKPSSKVKDESEDEDSDFEDPDTIAIPSEIKPLKSGDSAQSMPSFGGKHLTFYLFLSW